MKALLLMAHGAPQNLDDVAEYVLHIRHGRPLAQEQMAIIQDRYRQVGGSPLLAITARQAAALENKAGRKVYMGMRHSKPFIAETVEQMLRDGVDSIVALCLAPQFSSMTIGAYKKALDEAIAGRPLQYTLVDSYASHPGLIHAFSTLVEKARAAHPNAFVIFTAHSLPERVLQEGDPYDYQVKETARLLANSVGLPDWRFAYQSQGMTQEKWLGPPVEARIDELAAKGIQEILVVPVGFVCDHVEITYDIDVHFKEYAQARGIRLTRSESLNDSLEFIALLQTLVEQRL